MVQFNARFTNYKMLYDNKNIKHVSTINTI